MYPVVEDESVLEKVALWMGAVLLLMVVVLAGYYCGGYNGLWTVHPFFL